MWYENQPGPSAVAAEKWPDAASLELDSARWNLVVFLHPQCPCSQATLTELAVLQSRVTQRLRTSLVFYKPAGMAAGWEKSRILDQAAAMPDVSIVWDEGDRERQKFGAATSGQVLLFEGSGRLCYQGGITRARGQTGDNSGRATIERLVRGEAVSVTQQPVSQQPVFGCPLVDESDLSATRRCLSDDESGGKTSDARP